MKQTHTFLTGISLVLLTGVLSVSALLPQAGPVQAQAAAQATTTATSIPTTIPPTLPPAPPLATQPGATAAPTTSGQAAPTSSSGSSSSAPTRTPAPTARADEKKDSCEGNDTAKKACGIPLDAISGPYTFVPEGDIDYYGVDLGTTPGQALTVVVRATSGLDIRTTITRADTGAQVGTIESPAISTTLPADLTGWVRLRLENRGAGLSSGQSYRIELRRQAAAAPTASSQSTSSAGGTGTSAGSPDPLENNWSLDTAAPIAVGTAYELNFVCPDARPNACYGGDHDYLRVTVKANTPYLIATYDLAPGVDTVVDLFWGNRDRPLTGSDDAVPNKAFLSVLRWVAPANGEAIIRVAPRTGGLNPILPNGATSSYKIAVAIAGSELAQTLEATIAAQTFAPTPTPTAALPTPAASSAAPAPAAPAPAAPAPIAPTALPQRTISAGRAVVVTEVQMTTAPEGAGDLLATLPVESLVTLTGESIGTWVLVTTDTGVVPGWVDSRTLRLAAEGPARAAPAPVGQGAGQGAGSVTQPGPQAATATATSGAGSGGAQVTELLPVPPALPPAPPQRTSQAITVQVVQATDDTTPPLLDGVRVQVVNAFGDLVTEGETQRGRVTLTLDLVPGTALRVRLPAVGIDLSLDLRQPELTITLPGGGA